MPETLTKATKSQDAEKAQEKKRQPEYAPVFMKALADESVPFAGLLGVSAMELPFETHAAFLGDPRFSHPANNTQKAHMAMQLQQTYGNQYVQRLVESLNVQAKLTVSSPDEQYEKEADRVADAVTGASTPSIQRQAEEEEEIQSKPIAEQITPLVQRQEEEPIQTKLTDDMLVQRQAEEPEEEEEELIQTKLTNDIQMQRQAEEPEEEEEEKPIQTKKAGRGTPLISSSLQSRINSLKGGGQPLPESTREYFEPRFGSSFNNVRIHNDPQAASIAKSINAKAFTTGKDIVFGAGQYSPETSEGERLLAHELTHVVQQDIATVRGGEISNPNEPAEEEAQRVREAVSCDRQVLPIKASAAQVSRQRSRTKGPARPDSDLVTKLRDQVTKGGITVAIYCARGVGDRSTFEKAAAEFAKDHDAVGTTNREVKIPQAMTISTSASVGVLVQRTIKRVTELLLQDASGAKTRPPVKVKTLAIFTHGDTFTWKGVRLRRLQAGKRPGKRSWIYASGLQPWAEAFAPYLAHNVKVILYACRVSKDGKMSFANQLRLTLTQLMAKYIRVGQVAAPEVWGHTTTAHTTANPRLVGFTKGGSKDLLEWLAKKMLYEALKQAHRDAARREAQKNAHPARIRRITLTPKSLESPWPWDKSFKWKMNSLISYLRGYWEAILLGCMQVPRPEKGVRGEKLNPEWEKFIRDIPFRRDFQTVYQDVVSGNVQARVKATYKKVWGWLMIEVGPSKINKTFKVPGLPKGWCDEIRGGK